jgi:hypothetical protein
VQPFDDVRVRRALNLAVDRAKVVRLEGGSLWAQPSCQVLPPGIPGYSPYCPYTRAPNAAVRGAAPISRGRGNSWLHPAPAARRSSPGPTAPRSASPSAAISSPSCESSVTGRRSACPPTISPPSSTGRRRSAGMPGTSTT